MSATPTQTASGNAVVAPNELYDFDVDDIYKIGELRRRIREAEQADEPIERWATLLSDHLRWGNHKIADSVAIYNLGSGHDCEHRGTERCQVGEDECYAVQSENLRDYSLPYRRRQAILWDHLDPVTWAKAFRRHVQRKSKPVTAIRFSQSGDFRTQQDILKVNEIARRLDDLVDVFTYSASSDLDWSAATHFTVNRSNDVREYGDRRYKALPSPEYAENGDLHCPFDRTDGDIKCGECRLCIDPDAGDVYVTIHGR